MENVECIVPLRHGSIPGVLRLPKRYEHFATDRMSSASKRRSSIMPTQDENEEERMHDMMQAIMWVKHELVGIYPAYLTSAGFCL